MSTPQEVSTASAERQVRLAEIRRQIAAGTYETPEKVSAAVDKLLSILNKPNEPR